VSDDPGEPADELESDELCGTAVTNAWECEAARSPSSPRRSSQTAWLGQLITPGTSIVTVPLELGSVWVTGTAQPELAAVQVRPDEHTVWSDPQPLPPRSKMPDGLSDTSPSCTVTPSGIESSRQLTLPHCWSVLLPSGVAEPPTGNDTTVRLGPPGCADWGVSGPEPSVAGAEPASDEPEPDEPVPEFEAADETPEPPVSDPPPEPAEEPPQPARTSTITRTTASAAPTLPGDKHRPTRFRGRDR